MEDQGRNIFRRLSDVNQLPPPERPGDLARFSPFDWVTVSIIILVVIAALLRFVGGA